MPYDANCPPALAPFRTLAPADLLELADVKRHLNVEVDDWNALLTGFMAAAVGLYDGWAGTLGRCLVTQKWGQFFPAFELEDRMRLRLRPVSSIDAITYFDGDGTEQTLAADQCRVLSDDFSPFVAPTPDATWPGTQTRPDAVKVIYIAGYGAAADVPDPIKLAMKQLVAHWFENREAVGNITSEIPLGVNMLMAPFRVRTF